MTIRTACITAGAAALALPAFAGTPKIQATGAGLATPQATQPIRAAKFTVIDGQMVLTTPWTYPNHGPNTRGVTWNYRFDNIEIAPADPNGAPDFTDACGLGGGRWLLYTTDVATFDYCNPFITNDMDDMGAGEIDGMYLLWYQRAALPGSPPVPAGEQLFIAVFVLETKILDDCSVPDPVDTAQGGDGIILDFGVNANGFWYSAVDLSAFGFQLLAPVDGEGSYNYIFGSAFDPNTNTITLSTCVQSGLWGTAAPRIGTQSLVQYDDDNPTDGLHDPAFECYDYTYGVCPDPIGAAIGFMGMDESTGCACVGDLNADSIRDISDLAIMLSEFGSTNGGCDDINADGVTDISDLAAFLSNFGVPC